ncbi:hypothetical protein EOL96_00160 [Candidatus Saccharibacteria bacterium]|nr:hypothetical protein [Candidatus Saccharibacteria bacterium]
MKTPNLKFKSNFLLVNNRFMNIERVTAPNFEAILALGNKALIDEMTLIHMLTTRANPNSNVQRPSIGVLNLGNDSNVSVLSERGRAKGTGLYQDQFQLDERVHPYWRAILENGFLPEVRLLGRSAVSSIGDTNVLFLRDTPYEP